MLKTICKSPRLVLLPFGAALLALCLLAPSAIQAWENYSGRTIEAYVQEVDGGNIIMASERPNGKAVSFRLYGIGVPGPRQPFGREAHEELLALLPKGAKIILTTVNQDERGVVTALVQRNDHSVNNRLIDEGLAWVDRSTCKAFFCRRWHIQEHLAIVDRRGIWSLNMSTPPWQWGEQQ